MIDRLHCNGSIDRSCIWSTPISTSVVCTSTTLVVLILILVNQSFFILILMDDVEKSGSATGSTIK